MSTASPSPVAAPAAVVPAPLRAAAALPVRLVVLLLLLDHVDDFVGHAEVLDLCRA
jgi:hypothetical protein